MKWYKWNLLNDLHSLRKHMQSRILLRAIWGKTSPTQHFLTGTKPSPSWPQTGLQGFLKCDWLKPVWFLPPPTPTEYCRTTASLAHFLCVLEILEQIAGILRHVTLSVYLQKLTDGPPAVRTLSWNTCVISVTIYSVFIVTPGYLYFPYISLVELLRVYIIVGPRDKSCNK